ncbi:Lipase class 3 family protein [Spironucleus salmonicida]|nr:Lipase class 3 family protein [Spironucleus salmonicida]
MAKQCNTVYSETSLSKNILSQNKDAKVFMPVFQCYSEEDLIFIVVRGTEKMLTDGITDSQFQPLFCLIDGFNEPIHEGWFKAAVYVFRQVQQIIQFAWRNKMISKIVLTGHSYGAAVVSIISMFFKSYIPDLNQYCVTFGCPPHLGSRLCLKTFGKHYVNEDDPVCRYSKFYIKQEAIQKIVPKQFIDGQLSEWIEQSDYSSSTDLWIPGNILQIKNEVITPITRYQVNIPNIDFNKGDNHKISAYIKVLHNISLQK